MLNVSELKEMSKEKAYKTYIPKWPQCIINGKNVTPEQADDIIRRTDRYFMYPHGRNLDFDKQFEEISGRILNFRAEGIDHIVDYSRWNREWDRQYKRFEKKVQQFYEKWGYIELDYLDNHFINSSFFDGCFGWCHPDGSINGFRNIGKYPTVEEVEEDLIKLTEAFPFLYLELTLCLYEETVRHNTSLITMIAEKGKVKFYEPVPYEDLEIIRKKYDTSNYYSIDHIKQWFENNK